MVLIQIDLTPQENKKLKQYCLDYDIEDKRKAIKKLIGDLK